jgi:hypothetical protein
MCTCIYCLVEYSLYQDEPRLRGLLKQTLIQLRRDRTSEDYVYTLFCLVEYNLYQDEPWLGETIIPNTMRRDRTSEDDLYMYFVFSGVQPGPGRAVVGGDHYIKHNAPGRDERGRFVHVFCV